MDEKKLILSLIKDDMINTCLVNGLNSVGLDAGDYFLHLSETIFNLMGFEDDLKTEEIHRKYLQLTKKATPANISDSREKLDELALEVYSYLQTKRPGKRG